MAKKGKTVDAVKTRARIRQVKSARAKKNAPAEPIKRTAPKRERKGYDAEKYTGAIPGLADRMKEYLRTMRDDR
ncbi:MAG: hypothetical protein IT225_10580 [Flavobacteriales bacterium]|jgi:hypothetical protein|nr:hypothetical protein [Flavobacteriales bacterium]